MKESRVTSFNEYANFKYDFEPTISIGGKTIPLEKETDIGHGAYTSTIKLTKNKALKINRLLMIDLDGTVRLHGHSEKKYLVKKSKLKDNSSSVKKGLLQFGGIKHEVYSTIEKFLGDFSCKYYEQIIIDSPRKKLELSNLKARYEMALPQSTIEKIPLREIALAEIWEYIHPQNNLKLLGYTKLNTLLGTERKQINDLATKFSSLLYEKGILLDICDYGGISCLNPNDQEVKVKNIKQLVKIAEHESDLIPFPRNIVYEKQNFKFFDFYPIKKLNELNLDLKFEEMSALVNDNNLKEIRRKKLNKDSRLVLSYLLLLEIMSK